MNQQRAQEIIDSPNMINVTYQDIPIYIKYINSNEKTADIFPLDQPEREQTVPLEQLSEH